MLKGAAHYLKSNVVLSYCCYDKQHVTNGRLMKILKDENVPAKQFACAVTYIKFQPWDKEISPIPLQTEMFRSKNKIMGSC